MEAGPSMTLLTSVGGAFRGHVLVARLASEGIDAQLRGAGAGPYGLTMGDLARVDVYVPDDQLDDARYVLLSDEVDESLAAPRDWWDVGEDASGRNTRWARWAWLIALGLLVVALTGPLLGWLTNR
jgi:hypothetical protein